MNNNGDNPWSLALQSLHSPGQDREQVLKTLWAVGARGPDDLAQGSKDWGPQKSLATKTEEDVHQRCRHFLDEFLDRQALQGNRERVGGARVLALDGGGIRGLVLVKMLSVISEHVGLPVTHCFDWITGTSTGAILALALSTGLSPVECQSLYFRMKDKVFVGQRPYAVEPLEEFLKKQFTEEARMSDLPQRPKVAVTGSDLIIYLICSVLTNNFVLSRCFG